MQRFILRLIGIYLLCSFSFVSGVIQSGEYYFDADPGFGNGTVLTMTEGDSVSISEEISFSGLSIGRHTLNVRFKSEDDVWGHITTRPIFINALNTQSSQNLINGEYYFDADPGFGNGSVLSMTEGDSVSILEEISFSGLSIGRHTLNVRFQSEDGEWGHITTRPIFINALNTQSSQNLINGEYYFDDDPGFGNGTVLMMTEGDSVSILEEISFSGLSIGRHTLNVRFKSEDNVWGHITTRPIYVNALNTQGGQNLISGEYYFDNDPGFGNGTSLTMAEGDSVSISEDISFSGLSIGRHTLNVRFKSEDNVWGHITTRPIFIPRNDWTNSLDLVQGEYYFNTDPGVGNGYIFPITASDTISKIFGLPIDTLSLGAHILYVRLQNENNIWGFAQYDTIEVVPDIVPPDIYVILPEEDYSLPENTELTTTWLAEDNARVDSVHVYFSQNADGTYFYEGSSGADIAQYSFVVPTGITDEARVKLIAVDAQGLEGEGYSEYFSITDNTRPEISQLSIPDSVSFGIGSSMKISVSAHDNVEVTSLDLNYSTDDGIVWDPMVQDLSPMDGTASYDWLVPDIPGSCSIQAIVSDAVGLQDTLISESFDVVIEYPRLVSIPDQVMPTFEIPLGFTQIIDPDELITGTEVVGNIGGSYDLKITQLGSEILIGATNGYVALDTLRLVLSADQWANFFGYGLDGNGNGSFEGSPVDNDTAFTQVSAAGDYDQNELIDFDDFNAFVFAWTRDAFEFELYPNQGTMPFIKIQPDSSFDVFDLFAFASSWNWFAGLSQLAPETGEFIEVEYFSEQVGNMLTVDLGADELMTSQTIIKYDPRQVLISVGDNGLNKVSADRLSIVNANPDSGFILITSSHVNDGQPESLSLQLEPKTRYPYSIEIAFQGADEYAEVIHEKSNISLLPIPTVSSLSQNYPNPFNGSTSIEYGLPKNTHLNIIVYDIRGRIIKEIHSGDKPAGYHLTHWTGENSQGLNVASGLYFIVLSTPEYRSISKALLLK